MNQDYRQLIKDRLEDLPRNLSRFLQNESWRMDLTDIGDRYELTDEQKTNLENQVYLVLTCFEPKTDLSKNLVTDLSLDQDTADSLSNDIDQEIFAKVQAEIEEFWAILGPKNQQAVNPSSKVGDSFEQTIVSQTVAQQPIREESGQPTVDSRQMGQAPSNLPTGSQPAEPEKPRVIHNYASGGDPYRETV